MSILPRAIFVKFALLVGERLVGQAVSAQMRAAALAAAPHVPWFGKREIGFMLNPSSRLMALRSVAAMGQFGPKAVLPCRVAASWRRPPAEPALENAIHPPRNPAHP